LYLGKKASGTRYKGDGVETTESVDVSEKRENPLKTAGYQLTTSLIAIKMLTVQKKPLKTAGTN
jgi:hypothetical protein